MDILNRGQVPMMCNKMGQLSGGRGPLIVILYLFSIFVGSVVHGYLFAYGNIACDYPVFAGDAVSIIHERTLLYYVTGYFYMPALVHLLWSAGTSREAWVTYILIALQAVDVFTNSYEPWIYCVMLRAMFIVLLGICLFRVIMMHQRLNKVGNK